MPKLNAAELAKIAREITMFDSYDDYDIDTIVQVLKGADDLYHNQHQSYLTDEQYDNLRRFAEQAAPMHPYFRSIGSEVRGGKVKLPYPMGSLTQVYNGDTLDWVRKYNLEAQHLVVSEKLDGVSVLIVYGDDGKLQTAYSRGDGVEGADITRHISKIKRVPLRNSTRERMVVRAEAIISKENFKKVQPLVKTRGGEQYKNARNMMAGLMNAEKNEPIVYDYIDVVAYEVIEPSNLDKFDQLFLLRDDNDFMIPETELVRGNDATDERLTNLVNKFREESKYEIDGIVIDVNDSVKRKQMTPTKDTLNPEYARKFKVADASNLAIAEVVGVEWNVSKHGYLKPRVNIKPVQLVGVTVQFATGFNARFIYDNNIGPGAKVQITRSGDVIPFIQAVVEPTRAAMPSVDWKWNETEVDAVITNPHESQEVMIQQVLDFFVTIDAPLIKEGTVRAIFDAKDEFASVSSALLTICHLPPDEWQRIIGANGRKMWTGLQEKFLSMPLYTFLGAVPYFGRGVGTRKWKKLLAGLGITNISQIERLTVADIVGVEGFDEKTAKKIVNGIEPFFEFYKGVKSLIIFLEVTSVSGGSLEGKGFVFTGFRSKELEQLIEENGGVVQSGVSKKTSYLVAADPNENSTKLKKARDIGVKVIGEDELRQMLEG